MRAGVLVIWILSSCLVSAQTFNVNIDQSSMPNATSALLSLEDNFYLAGSISSWDLASNRLVFYHYDYSGEQITGLMYGDSVYDYNDGSIISDHQGGLILEYQRVDTGLTTYMTHNSDIVLFGFSEDGELLWSKLLEDSMYGEAATSTLVHSDTLFMTGFRVSYETSEYYTFLYKLSPTGDSLSLHTYGHPDYDFIGNKLIRAQNGDFLIAGYARGIVDRDRLLLRIAPNGELLWYEIYEGDYYPSGSYDAFMDLLELADGSILLAGRFSDYAQQDANLVKVSSEGEVIWDITFGGGDNDWFEAIYERNDTLFLGGNWRSDFPSGEIDAWVMATDTSGNMLWSHTYNPDGVADNEANDYLYDFTLTGDGGMAFCGWSSRETQDAWIMKLDGNGLCDTASCFPDLVGITPQVLQGTPAPRIFPNPVSDYLTIQNSVSDELTWRFYDPMGQEVWRCQTAGQQTQISITHLPAGLYMVTATDGIYTRYAGKLVVE